MYCVYLTTYSGNLLPPFYIGSTNIKNIFEGYHGSVTSSLYKQIWKQEILNNKELFKTKIISIHDTRQKAFDTEMRLQKRLNVINSPLYINQSIANKNFSNHGKKFTEAHKNKIGEGNRKPKQRKNQHLSDEHKNKIANSLRGKKRPPAVIEKMKKSHQKRLSNRQLAPVPDMKNLKIAKTKGKSLTMNGIEYYSISQACRELKMSFRTVIKNAVFHA